MKSESALIDVVTNHAYTANLKEAGNGKYIACSVSNARRLGMAGPTAVVGLTINDMQYAKSEWGARHAALMAEMDFRACDEKICVSSRQPFIDADGLISLEEVTKAPVLGKHRNVIGIVSFQQDLTATCSIEELYGLYRSFFGAYRSIRHMLIYLGVEQCFAKQPSETQFRVFLGKVERLSSKQIAKRMGISPRTVDCHLRALGNRTQDGDLLRVSALAKPRFARNDA
jgi:hypothetical protein